MHATGWSLAVVFTTSTLFAQVSGRVTGTVVDPSGASVPNARVGLLLSGGKIPLLTTLTNADGIFDFTGVRPETYTLEVEAPGFNKHTDNDLRVDPAHEVQLPPIALTLALAAERVDVTTHVAMVDTSSAEASNTVTQAQIINLPVLDRNLINLFNTQAGFAANNRGPAVINGMRSTFSNVTMDGVLIQDTLRENALDITMTQPTITQAAEFTVATTNPNPALGGAASTIVIATPSGTNELHGSGYWFNRNNYFAANDWFNNKNGLARPGLNLNQIGGTVGGPIVKDKLFFYGAYEAYRRKQQRPVSLTIPTPTAREGILQYPAGGSIQQFNVLRPFNLQPSPLIQSYLAQIPVAGNNNSLGDGLNTTGYTFNGRTNSSADNYTVKVDYNLSSRHAFSVSYNWHRATDDRPDQGVAYTVVPPVYDDVRSTLVSGAWRWNPKPTLTNEVRAGFDFSAVPFPDRQGIPSYLLVGLFFNSPIVSRQVGRDFDQYNVADKAQWVHGKHTVSFGFQTSQLHNYYWNFLNVPTNYFLGISASSPYGFRAGDIPGASSTYVTLANSMLSSIAGLVYAASKQFSLTSPTSGYVPSAPITNQQTFRQYALYAVDNFRIRRNLTLTLGLRWDDFLPVNETDGLAIEPRLINNSAPATLLGNATLDFARQPFYKNNLRNFAPNLSLAWDPFGDGKTSIRSGFNIAYVNDNSIAWQSNSPTRGSVTGTNVGITKTQQLSNLNATVDRLPTIPTPPFAIPTSTLDQFTLSGYPPPNEGLYDPNLKIPYVEQWVFSIQREVKGWVFEGRYVGNHAVKMYGLVNSNEVNLNQGDFLADFSRARSNGFAALNAGRPFSPLYDSSVPGSQPLTFLGQLAPPLLAGSLFTGYLRTGEIANFAQVWQQLVTPYPRLGFSFFPNPYLNNALEMTNRNTADYNGLQLEVRKRTRNGFEFQANYTFGKALSTDSYVPGDTAGPTLNHARADYDLTHAFKFNHYIPLPIGSGHRLASFNPVWKRVLDGWALGGVGVLQTGSPVGVLSGRATLYDTPSGQTTLNSVDTTATLGQLHQDTGLFMTGNGPYWINPSHVGPDGSGVAPDGAAPFPGQIFFNPQPATRGSLQIRSLDGPPFRTYNFSVIKSFSITERQKLDFHVQFFNLFNHPNFIIPGDFNVNTPNFGKILSDVPTCLCSNMNIGPRLVQYGLYYRF